MTTHDELLRAAKARVAYGHDTCCAASPRPPSCVCGHDALVAAIAKAEAQPAPAAERDAAIEAWRASAESERVMDLDGDPVVPRSYRVTKDEIDEAVALMRSAPPAPNGAREAETAYSDGRKDGAYDALTRLRAEIVHMFGPDYMGWVIAAIDRMLAEGGGA